MWIASDKITYRAHWDVKEETINSAVIDGL